MKNNSTITLSLASLRRMESNAKAKAADAKKSRDRGVELWHFGNAAAYRKLANRIKEKKES